MFKLIFTNSRGESAELFSSPYRLIRFDGLGDVAANHQTQKSPFQDGATLSNTTLKERYPEIELKITAKDELELASNRRRLVSIFNPKLGHGTLKRVSADGTHQIRAIAETVPFFPDGSKNRSRTFQKTLIQLYCPNPYWLDEYELGKEISTWIGGLKFPFSLPFTLRQRGETKQKIYNSGDVETPVEIIFKGPALNPKVTNHTTEEFIRVKRELTSDATLYITTGFGDKKVEIERNGMRENAFHYIDLDSTFFSLQVGDNLIEYSTESPLDSQGVEIRYYNRYIGI